DPTRLSGWIRLSEASLLSPWAGYGWGQIISANFAVAENFQGNFGLFAQSHNGVLDLVLWNGYVLAAIIMAVVIVVCVQTYRRNKSLVELHYVGFLIVLGVHSMLEFPLHYAYFLLPFGLIVGILQSRAVWSAPVTIRRSHSLVILSIGV
ncbi:MAG: Wzy polymerase domain-containing protein, partial [Rhodoferax sp.]